MSIGLKIEALGTSTETVPALKDTLKRKFNSENQHPNTPTSNETSLTKDQKKPRTSSQRHISDTPLELGFSNSSKPEPLVKDTIISATNRKPSQLEKEGGSQIADTVIQDTQIYSNQALSGHTPFALPTPSFVMSPFGKHVNYKAEDSSQQKIYSIDEKIGQGAFKEVFGLKGNEDIVFVQSKGRELPTTLGTYGIFKTTPTKSRGIARKGTPGTSALKLNVNQQLQIMLHLCLDLQKIHDSGQCHLDIKEHNFCFTPSSSTTIKKAAFIDLDDCIDIGAEKKSIQGTTGYISPEILSNYESKNQTANTLRQLFNIDFYEDTILGKSLLNSIKHFKYYFPSIIANKTSQEKTQKNILTLKEKIESEKKFTEENPDLVNKETLHAFVSSMEKKLGEFTKGVNVSTPMDIYSFGCLMIKLVTGRHYESFIEKSCLPELSNISGLQKKLISIMHQHYSSQGRNINNPRLLNYLSCKLINKIMYTFHSAIRDDDKSHLNQTIKEKIKLTKDSELKLEILDIAFKCINKKQEDRPNLDQIFLDLNKIAQTQCPEYGLTDTESIFSSSDDESASLQYSPSSSTCSSPNVYADEGLSEDY